MPLDRAFRSLSKGEAMKAMLVAALCEEPELLLLDEPFSGLDPLVREDGRLLVRNRASPFGALRYSLVDLRDGRFAWTAIPCPWDVVKVDLGFLAFGAPYVVRDPEEAVVLHGSDHVAGCFPYDLRCGPLVPGTWLGRLSAHDVLVRHDGELWRCDLRDGARTRLPMH